ncbi:hypothetical protein [Nitrincola sp.]|uniref:hypothetical protein n=1 Tax=Nitrincola sp. TaxID=1926584 RepID=UPI003A923CC5
MPDDDFDTALSAVKGLFKALKATGFGIQIDHWGAILLTTPERPTDWELSLCLATPALPVTDLIEQLASSPYLKLPPTIAGPKLYLRARAWQRRGTRWIWQPLPNDPLLPEAYDAFIHQVLKRARQLAKPSPPAEHTKLQITLKDVLAVLRYDAQASQERPLEQACLPRMERYSIRECRLEQGLAILRSRHYNQGDYVISRPGQRLLKQLLPDYGKLPMEFFRPF